MEERCEESMRQDCASACYACVSGGCEGRVLQECRSPSKFPGLDVGERDGVGIKKKKKKERKLKADGRGQRGKN